MSFQPKTDYIGLETTLDGIKLRSNGDNASNGVLQIHGSDGSYIGEEVYGHIKSPTCEYAITGNGNTSSISLGTVYGTGAVPFALSRLQITTGAGVEPVINADAVQIEENASRTVCVYPIGSFAYSPAHHASTFGAFTYSESTSLTLQNCDLEATANIQPATVNGDPVGSDAVEGVVTVNATMWNTSDTVAPSVSMTSGWKQTSDWACTGPDSGMFQWTGQFVKYLSASEAT